MLILVTDSATCSFDGVPVVEKIFLPKYIAKILWLVRSISHGSWTSTYMDPIHTFTSSQTNSFTIDLDTNLLCVECRITKI